MSSFFKPVIKFKISMDTITNIVKVHTFSQKGTWIHRNKLFDSLNAKYSNYSHSVHFFPNQVSIQFAL